jgi:hypothetical protein
MESAGDEISSVPFEQAHRLANRIIAAAEIGDVIQVASIANESKSENDGLSPFCNKIIQLADDFDLDGILKLANELSG